MMTWGASNRALTHVFLGLIVEQPKIIFRLLFKRSLMAGLLSVYHLRH